MLNQPSKVLLLLASSVLPVYFSQPVVAATHTVKAVKAGTLKPQKFSSSLELAKLLLSHQTDRYRYDRIYPASGDFTVAATSNSAVASKVSHSETNIQVQGVDESDGVKVGEDGYIYQLAGNKIRIIRGFPVSDLNQEATIAFSEDDNFSPTGLYVFEGKLVVLGTSWQSLQPEKQPASTTNMAFWGFWNQYAQTRLLVYDVSNHAKPVQVRDVAIDGDYVDSRRMGDNVYFISRTYPRYYMYGVPSASLIKPATIFPGISDKKNGKTKKKLLPLRDIAYFPGFVEPDYVIASSIDIKHPEKAPVTKAYLGAGEMLYASEKSLYLSASKYNFAGKGDAIAVPVPAADTSTTQIFKFAIQDGRVDFTAAGEVPGTALNQFSMDENGGYFRIATTTNNWVNGASHNSLFVLNKNMKTVGKLSNLAKGEQIYSVRFMGNRCYLVTFRLVDPLFAIDLSRPAKPVVMGELKIPGYSSYLHPYDETHLIGFGKDAAVYSSEKADADQAWAGGSAFYQGLKLALFDVADMKHPKELHSITIGDRGSDSPLLWDHKALYWDAKQHVFGFPVQQFMLSNGFNADQPWLYGLPVSQAAYVYKVSPEQGFTLQAKLSQLPEGASPHVEKGEGYEYAYWEEKEQNLFVDRIVSIDSHLYTLSNSQISVYDAANYEEKATLALNP